MFLIACFIDWYRNYFGESNKSLNQIYGWYYPEQSPSVNPSLCFRVAVDHLINKLTVLEAIMI